MLQWTRRKLLAVLMIGAVALSGCERRPQGEDLTNVRFVASKNLWTAVPIVAHRQGYFRDEGLNVNIEFVQAARFAMDAVVAGSAQLGAVVEINVAYAALAGNRDVRLLSTISRAYDSGIVARRDAGINAPRDLAGKRLGVLTATTSEIFAERFLRANDVDPSRVNLQSLQPVAMQTAIVERSIDAASIWQPFIHNIERALGRDNVIVFRDRNAYTGYMNVAGRAEWIAQNRDTVDAFMRALDRALRFIQDNPEQAQAIVADEVDLDIEVVRAIWGEYAYSNRLAASELTEIIPAQAEWIVRTQPNIEGPVPDFRPYLLPWNGSVAERR